MAYVEGSVIFRPKSNSVDNQKGISGVTIYLRDEVTDQGIAVLTDSVGYFKFNNVPNGNYRLIQSNQEVLGVNVGEVDFTLATAGGPELESGVPDVSKLNEVVLEGSRLNSLSSIIRFITIDAIKTFANEYFIYSLVMDKSMPAGRYVKRDINIFDSADYGTFGVYPPGTEVKESLDVNPYQGVFASNKFAYVKFEKGTLQHGDIYPLDDTYALINTVNFAFDPADNGLPPYTFHNFSDHSMRDERGRMMLIANNSSSQELFNAVIDVRTNTDYKFSFWALNTIESGNVEQPYFRITVYNENDEAIYYGEKKEVIQTEIPTWVEIGEFVNSGASTKLKFSVVIEFNSLGKNFYAVDDIKIYEVEKLENPQLLKTVDKLDAELGETLSYQLFIPNPFEQDIKNVILVDTIPDDTTLVNNSIVVKGQIQADIIPVKVLENSIKSNDTLTVTYSVNIDDSPLTSNSIKNIGYIAYEYTDIDGKIVSVYLESAEVETLVITPKLEVIKFADKSSVKLGEILNYTILITNKGNVAIRGISLKDIMSNELMFIANTLLVNGINVNGNITNDFIMIGALEPNKSTELKLKARLVALPISNEVTNSAIVRGYFNSSIDGVTETNYEKISNVVATSVSQESSNEFTDIRFIGNVLARGNGYILFNHLSSTSNNIRLINGYVQISSYEPNNYYKVAWSVAIDRKGDNGSIDISLLLNTNKLSNTQDIVQNCGNVSGGNTITGESIFELGVSENYLTLQYIADNCSNIEIVGASIKIIEMNLN